MQVNKNQNPSATSRNFAAGVIWDVLSNYTLTF